MVKQRNSTFLVVNYITIACVFLLVLVGGIVRSTGAGMGCPDWPKCFGSYLPPSSESELPEGYANYYQKKRFEKTQKLTKILSFIGLDRLLNIDNQSSTNDVHQYNTKKAYIEYINRLLGVLTGFFVLLNAFTILLTQTTFKIKLVGAIILILTIFQGWVGSVVVYTNLARTLITFHLVLALLILWLLIWMNVRFKKPQYYSHKFVFFGSILVNIFLMIQVLLGTKVRAVVDGLIEDTPDRLIWVSKLVGVFQFHRTFSWLVLVGALWIGWTLRKHHSTRLKITSRLILSFVVISMVSGITLIEFHFPFWMQPLHLVFATGIFSALSFLTLHLKIN